MDQRSGPEDYWLGPVQEEREHLFLSIILYPAGERMALTLPVGWSKRGDRSKKWTLLYICVSTIFWPVSTETLRIFPKGYFSIVWGLTQEMCSFSGRPKSLWFLSGDQTSCTSIRSCPAQVLETSFLFVKLFCSLKDVSVKDGIRTFFSMKANPDQESRIRQ